MKREEKGRCCSLFHFSLDFSPLICVVWYSPDFCTRSFSISILRLEKKKKSFPLQMWHRSVWALHIGPSFQTALLALYFFFFLPGGFNRYLLRFLLFFSFLNCLAKKVSFFLLTDTRECGGYLKFFSKGEENQILLTLLLFVDLVSTCRIVYCIKANYNTHCFEWWTK